MNESGSCWRYEIIPLNGHVSISSADYVNGILPEFVNDKYERVITDVDGEIDRKVIELPCWPEAEMNEYRGLVRKLVRGKGFSLGAAKGKACLMVRRRFKRDSNNGKNKPPVDVLIEPKNPWNS